MTLCTYLLFPHVSRDTGSLQNTRLKHVLLSEAPRDRHDLGKGGQICLAISASVYPSSTSKAPPARKMSMRQRSTDRKAFWTRCIHVYEVQQHARYVYIYVYMYGDIAVMTEIIGVLVCAFAQRALASSMLPYATQHYPMPYPPYGHGDGVQHPPLIRIYVYTRSSRLPTRHAQNHPLGIKPHRFSQPHPVSSVPPNALASLPTLLAALPYTSNLPSCAPFRQNVAFTIGCVPNVSTSRLVHLPWTACESYSLSACAWTGLPCTLESD